MPIANSSAELEQMIRNEVSNAMNELNSKALQDMQEETRGFYSLGNPTLYTRTGKLGNSPRVTGVSSGLNNFSFEFYLEQQSYTVPNPVFTSRGYASYFSPLQVLNAAEYHFAHVKGRPGFWHRSELKVERDMNRIFRNHFS